MPGSRSVYRTLRSARLILFDLDGTLVDSLPDLALSIDQTMVALGLPQPGEAAVGGWLGDGVAALVKRALTNGIDAEPDSDLFDRAMPMFMQHYTANNGRVARPYPNALQLLQALRGDGRQLGCVTNKPQAFTEPLLQKLGLHAFLDCVVSGDQVARKKPHPDLLLTACRSTGVATSAAFVVGDSRNDVQAARAAGMPVVCASYGYNQDEDIRNARPDALVDDLCEVAALLRVRFDAVGA